MWFHTKNIWQRSHQEPLFWVDQQSCLVAGISTSLIALIAGISASCLKLGQDTTESQLLDKIMWAHHPLLGRLWTNIMSKIPNKPSMYIVHVSTNCPPPHQPPNANMDRRLYPQIFTHKKFKLNIFPNIFQGSEQRPFCARNHSSDAPRQRAGGENSLWQWSEEK